jgi:hypothetical protein
MRALRWPEETGSHSVCQTESAPAPTPWAEEGAGVARARVEQMARREERVVKSKEGRANEGRAKLPRGESRKASGATATKKVKDERRKLRVDKTGRPNNG